MSQLIIAFLLVAFYFQVYSAGVEGWKISCYTTDWQVVRGGGQQKLIPFILLHPFSLPFCYESLWVIYHSKNRLTATTLKSIKIWDKWKKTIYWFCLKITDTCVHIHYCVNFILLSNTSAYHPQIFQISFYCFAKVKWYQVEACTPHNLITIVLNCVVQVQGYSGEPCTLWPLPLRHWVQS